MARPSEKKCHASSRLVDGVDDADGERGAVAHPAEELVRLVGGDASRHPRVRLFRASHSSVETISRARRAFSRADASECAIDAGCVRSTARSASTSSRPSATSSVGLAAHDREERPARGVLVDPRVLEQQLQVHVEDAGGAVAALDVAADPEQRLGDAAQHGRLLRSSGCRGDRLRCCGAAASLLLPARVLRRCCRCCAGAVLARLAAACAAACSTSTIGDGRRDRRRGLVGDEAADAALPAWRATVRRATRWSGAAEHPGVLRSAALARVHDELALGQRDAGEAAGQHPDVLAVVDRERAQVGVARPHAVLDEGRDRRELHDRLRDPAARVGEQPRAQLVELGAARHPARRRGPCRPSRRRA